MSEQSIGAFWLKESAKGVKYMSGKITIDGVEHQIVLFKNTLKKEGEKTPDYRIFASKPREGEPARATDDSAIPF